MKVRKGFVSNSSSSSFLIPIAALKYSQVLMIKDHINATDDWLKYHRNETDISCDDGDRWTIVVNEKCVLGYTWMDNFDMHFFLTNIAEIEEKYIHWGEDDDSVDLDQLNREILSEQRKDKLDKLNEE